MTVYEVTRSKECGYLRYVLAAVFAGLVISLLLTGAASAHDDVNGKPHFKGSRASPTAVMRAFAADSQSAQNLPAAAEIPCAGGTAGSYPCHGIDLLAFLPIVDIGGGGTMVRANDIWGWTDTGSGREFALVGRNDGTAFVEVTDPVNPVYLGILPTHTETSSWRDIKVHNNHAFVVSEASGHGMQVFDLTQLLSIASPQTFAETAQYNSFGHAHNVAINESSGYAYAVGTDTCLGGLHMIDINDPLLPTDAGCFDEDGYTHDAQCVIYRGPDAAFSDREICIAANEDTLTIVDVSDKTNPVLLSSTDYNGRGYVHQAWLSDDHALIFLDDELDEKNFGHGTRTRVWSAADLAAPTIVDEFTNSTPSIDHNLYVKGDFVFQANYTAGMSVLEIERESDGSYSALNEVAFFDIFPESDNPRFKGAWSNYPYFPSGTIVLSGIEQGLYVLALNIPDEISWVTPFNGASVAHAVPLQIVAKDGDREAATPTVEWKVGNGGAWQPAAPVGNNHYEATWVTANLPDGPYDLYSRMTDATGEITEAGISVIVDNHDLPPSAQFLSPGDGDEVSGRVMLRAMANDDDSIVAVTFFDNGIEIGTDTDSSDGWSIPWNTNKVSKDLHTISVRAEDNAGQFSNPALDVGATHSVTVVKGGGPKCNPKRGDVCPGT